MKKTTFILAIALLLLVHYLCLQIIKNKTFADDVVTRETTKYYEVDSKIIRTRLKLVVLILK